MTHESAGNGVRVTTAQIYALLQEANGRVASVQQTVREVVTPGLEAHSRQIEALEKEKADQRDLDKTDGRVSKLELRVYAILAGLLAALGGLKGLGIV